MTLTFRPYEEGNETAILALFEASFGRPMDPSFWTWRFMDNPLGGPWIELAWDGDRLAGHYAISPQELVHGESRLLTALSMTTMTHPDYRGQDLFGRLADRLYERLEKAGFACVWGFPNRFSHRLFNNRLQWRDIGEIPTLTLTLKEARIETPDSAFRQVPCEDALPDLDLIAKNEGNGCLRLGRASGFYDWRVRHAHGTPYRAFTLMQGHEKAGFVVIKPYGAGSFDIPDFVARDEHAARALIALVIALAQQEKKQRLQVWLSLFHPFRGVLERAGFMADAPVTMLGARWFESPAYDPYDMRLWRLPMIASDVF